MTSLWVWSIGENQGKSQDFGNATKNEKEECMAVFLNFIHDVTNPDARKEL